ncbi:MAG: exonuclease domain-containing protein [Pseudomonadota bacterium]
MKQLPTFYYRQNFRELVDFVVRHYAPVLSCRRRQWLGDFEALPDLAQCLYVRLLNRQGTIFERSKLTYPELGDLDEHLGPLRSAGFVRSITPADLDEVLVRLTKSRIVACADEPELKTSWTKKQCAAFVRDNGNVEQFLRNVSQLRPIVVARDDSFAFFKFLYFGRMAPGTSPLTLRDLGIAREHGFEDYEPRFSAQDEAEHAFFFAKERHRLESGLAHSENAVLRRFGEWPAADSNVAEQHRDKLALALGRSLEARSDPVQAVDVYRRGGSDDCLRSACRLLSQQRRTDELRELLNAHITSPKTMAAHHYAVDAMARRFGAKPRTEATEFLRRAVTLELDEYYRGSPEYAVVSHYRTKGQIAFRTENHLWLTLFGLLFWDLIFEATAAHSPFDGLPGHLVDGSFYSRNMTEVERRLESLSDRNRAIRTLLQSAIRHHGEQRGLFRWHPVTLQAISALIENAPQPGIAKILRSLCQSFPTRKRGYPDLMIIAEGRVAFVEVKAPGDHIRSHQIRRIKALCEAGLPTSVVRVEWKHNPDQPYCVVDVETTGGRAGAHRVTEIGAVKMVNGDVVNRFATLINPDRPIPPKITRLTGIRNDMVATAPRFAEIADDFARFLEGSIFCAHNVNFDYGFIRMEFERVGHRLRLPKRCTCASMRKSYPGRKSYALKALCREFDIPLRQHHRALCDAEAAAELLRLTLPSHQATPDARAVAGKHA